MEKQPKQPIAATPLPTRPSRYRTVLDAARSVPGHDAGNTGTVLDAAKRHPKFQERTEK